MLRIVFKKFGILTDGEIVAPDGGIALLASKDNSSGKSTLAQTIDEVLIALRGGSQYSIASAKKAWKLLESQIKKLSFEIVNFQIQNRDGHPIITINSGENETHISYEKPDVIGTSLEVNLGHNKAGYVFKNIENSLHPARQIHMIDELFKSIRETSRHTIVTTNSPYILQKINRISLSLGWYEKVKFYLVEPPTIKDVSKNIDPIYDSFTRPLMKIMRSD